jgi:hypothetical protein
MALSGPERTIVRIMVRKKCKSRYEGRREWSRKK